MKKFFQKLTLCIGVMLIFIGSAGWVYTYMTDHRHARSLSAYCDIDFQTGFNVKGHVSSATLSIFDYRFSRPKLLPSLTLICDDESFEVHGVAKQQPPTYSLVPFSAKTSFKNTNKLFVEFPAAAYSSLKHAGSIRIRFAYDNGEVIELPLDTHDMGYWKEHMQDKI